MITNHPKTRMGDKVLNNLLVSQRALSKKKTISGADGLNDHKPPQNAHGRQGFRPTFGIPAAFLKKKKQFQAPKAQMITNQPKMRIPDVVLDQLWLPGASLLAKP